MTDRAEYWQTEDGQWHWHIKARNGEVVAQGESYDRMGAMLDMLTEHFPDARQVMTMVPQ